MSLAGGSLVLYSVETARAAFELLARGKLYSEISEATGLSMSQISRLRNGETRAYYFLYVEYAARIASPKRTGPREKLPKKEEEEMETDASKITACRSWEQQNAFVTPEKMYELSKRLTNLMPMKNRPDRDRYYRERIEREIKLQLMSIRYAEIRDEKGCAGLYEEKRKVRNEKIDVAEIESG
jgi:transcriptional regulator with XRE-family HTH domain